MQDVGDLTSGIVGVGRARAIGQGQARAAAEGVGEQLLLSTDSKKHPSGL